tara:strand:- start:544 stop:1068 length:525 start_codon:yes stop_codon:yes gene_type:complete
MRDHMQTIINVCLAIFITIYIIQNDKLNEQVKLLNKELEAVNIGLIKTLYSDYNTAFIKNDFPRIASHFEAPVNFASNEIIAETEKDVIERYKVMKSTIQEGYAYSVTGDVTIKRQTDNSYLLCADFTRFNKQKEVLFEGRAEYQWVNFPNKGWKMNYLKGIDRGSNSICMRES